MNEAREQFRTALRGYEPAQVDQRIRELHEAGAAAVARVKELTDLVAKLEAEREQEPAPAEQAPPQPATFEHLGERVGQILALAEAEAADLRGAAQELLDAETAKAAEASGRIRGEADRYAENRRADADTEATRILEEARRKADQLVDGAERNAAARLQEAEAVYEEQRARAAKAAADFETTLAGRKKAAEDEFARRMAEMQQREDDLEAAIAHRRNEAEGEHSDAVKTAKRIVEEAERQAAAVIGEAKTTAARVRAESERELAAATQRRDSINAQLTNVRQMLVTLTGSAPVALLDDPAPAGPDDTDEPQADEPQADDEQQEDEQHG